MKKDSEYMRQVQPWLRTRRPLLGDDELSEAVLALLDGLLEVLFVALQVLDLLLARVLLPVEHLVDVVLVREEEHPPHRLVDRRLVGQGADLLRRQLRVRDGPLQVLDLEVGHLHPLLRLYHLVIQAIKALQSNYERVEIPAKI